MPQPISSSTPTQVSAPESGPPASPQAVQPKEVECRTEAINVARAGVALAGSVAALVAATRVVGVLPGLAAFVGASMYLGQSAAEYLSCRDQTTAKPK
jgi:hypothetical protein